ncbi:hypothetical protein [Microbacterium sp. P05]|uniref:hypothetical protein n=1 Tax=Microbacterium sp. P05 TaxID=3366948 RepID=UPI003744F421
MTRMRPLPTRRRRALLASGVIVAVAMLFGSPGVAMASAPRAAAATDCAASAPAPSTEPPAEGIDVTATVLGTPSCSLSGNGTGSGVANGTGSGTGNSGSSLSSGSSSNVPATVAPTATTPAANGDEVDLGGVMYVGGVSSASIPSLNPFGGTLQLWFTVRNVSASTIDAKADFWMESIFGNRISTADGVLIEDLKPGEMRTVSAELPGVGQWSILSAHTRLTPPDSVDGTALTPLTRDATAFALPWLFVLLVAAGLATWAIVQVLRRREATQPAGVFA